MKMKILLCMSLLAVSCLCGCRQKEKVSFSETYDTKSISSINMQIDSWQLKIMASSDEDVHISLDGGTEKGAKAPSVEVQDGMLDIMQIDGEGSAVGRFYLGKEGSKLAIDNDSGYAELNHVTAEELEISSSSGDVKMSNGNIADFQIGTSSGYVTLKNIESEDISIATKSGEVNISGLGDQTNVGISTGSGDIGVSYKTQQQNLSFKISSGSDDVSVRLDSASYTTETSACKQGKIGSGGYSLTVNSDSGTVVIH